MLADGKAAAVSQKVPAGWEAGCSWNSELGTGEITTGALEAEPDAGVWKELIADWSLDPLRYQVVPGSVQVRGWDAPVGGGEVRRLRYYRARIVDREVLHGDVDELVRVVGRKSGLKRPVVETGFPAFVVSLNDWQVGKASRQEGSSAETVGFLVAAWERTLGRLRELERLGRRPSRVVLANTGDLVEGTSGHYATQTWSVDLNMREQLRVARRLLLRMVDDLVGRGYGVLVTAVPCNHGQNRLDGKAYTSIDDNASLSIVEGVSEACSTNPDRYGGRVEFAYASDLTLVLDVCGVNVGLTHGHQIRGGGSSSAVAKVEKWWQGQIMGSQPIAAADMLLTSHLHHLNLSEETGRTVIIAPAADGGSYWFTSATGRSSPRGMLSLTIGDMHERGWGDLHVA